jgi:predicted metal-dependent HD superfamily phosphohydrolase
MTWPARERWLALCEAAAAPGAHAGWYERLTAAYAEAHRHYHNQQHIAECLAQFDAARHLARDPIAVELALWFHDAVYDPRKADNEEQSAALAKRCLAELGLGDALAETVAALIMTTKTHGVRADSDAALTVDIDLSILGQDEKRFSEYEQQICREYAWVPQLVFTAKRA